MEDFASYVLTGVRRAGKSFMLYQQIQQNLKRSIFRNSFLESIVLNIIP
ncbi:MAG: AAA family ATPase [Prevotella sp.]|jgi:predicted AAA+ superfamily ATPase|nr:AAA family ATPase [Prevotella sp.]MCH4018077.1 AAA family ATPase [Prevotella sp.]MCI1324019.1 AAA family ATPase [Prevotella sp.]